ncbi:hypothetical protein D3C71_1848190 [compost metagenome]
MERGRMPIALPSGDDPRAVTSRSWVSFKITPRWTFELLMRENEMSFMLMAVG